MKKILLLCATIASVVLASCSEEGEGSVEKAVEIEVKTGDTYAFDASVEEVLVAPHAFYAEVTPEGIKGVRAGSTTARVKVGNVTYDCKIVVEAKNTLYLDMMYLLGANLEVITKLYGEPIRQKDDTYLFGPMMGYGLEKGNMFSFKDDKVEMATIVFAASYAKEISAHLADRYVLAAKDDVSVLFVNGLNDEEWDRGVLLTVSTSNEIFVSYAARDFMESSPTVAEMSFKALLN